LASKRFYLRNGALALACLAAARLGLALADADALVSAILMLVFMGAALLVSAALTERRSDDELAYQASHDPLTGLPNRALFIDRLEHALARARRSRSKIAVVFLDLDNFKLVNDTHGHAAGDRLLLAISARLSAAVRPGDTVARFGGDEFVVLCEDLAGEEDAVRIARRTVDAGSRPVEIGAVEHKITVSAGIAIVDEGHLATASDLLRDADAAMYRAKASGKGDVEMFDERMRARLIERTAVERALRQALDEGELRLRYQPIVSLRDNRVAGVEALVRWENPERGLLQASEFMSVAESSGLSVPIGEWVIEEACRQAVVWNAGRDRIYVSVNLSPRQLVRSDVTAAVLRSLSASGLAPELLEIEVSERALLESGDACVEVLAELKAIGVRVAIDDFGTGYSSLGYLKRLTIDALRIDRSFVRGLGPDTEDSTIISAVVSMAAALDVEVIAEGVETLGQLARLRALGCEFAQPRTNAAFSRASAWAAGFCEFSSTTPYHCRPRRAAATRHGPAATVYPVLTPSAPG
jgi:diguanylate cyclase (GGDEF)-like protein